MVEHYIPEEHREDFVFHAYELFSGGGKVFHRDKWPLEKRLAIADELAAIPDNFGLPITFGWVERAKFPSTFSKEGLSANDLAIGAHVTAFMSCAMQVEHWMRHEAPDEVCMLIVEDNDRARKMIRDTQLHHQRPEIVKGLDERGKEHFPFIKIKEEPSFQRKRKLNPLQVADFCAFVFKRFLMNQNDPKWLRFFNPMRDQMAAYDYAIPRKK
jgi:hypothetical protein